MRSCVRPAAWAATRRIATDSLVGCASMELLGYRPGRPVGVASAVNRSHALGKTGALPSG